MSGRVRANQAMRHVISRLNGHGRDVNQDNRGAPTWVATCPNHDGRSGTARFDQDTKGNVAVHPHRNNGTIVCTPEQILAALAITDDRIKPYSSNGHRGGVGGKTDPFAKPARVRRPGGPVQDSHEIYERLKTALVEGGFTNRRGHPRYNCPACGEARPGRGLRIQHNPNAAGTKRRILLVCDSNRCPPEEILKPLGLTLADICAGDDVDDPDDDETDTSPTRGPTARVPRPGAAGRPRYFKRGAGLLVATLAEDVISLGPLAAGTDDILWSYHHGVWSPDRHVVRNRAAQLLGETYRRGHGSNTEDVVRSRVRNITCDPISEVINFHNGLYYRQPGTLHPHTPDVLSTVQLPVDWNPDATCPAFDKFLTQVVPADMVDLIWELIGYLLHSGNPLHKAVMLTGTGRNGKGTLLRVLVALLGERNVTAVSLHDLVNTRFSTASLFGKIANIAGDIDGTYLESTATFKAITGQDQISAEHKGRDRFDFTPWAVPVFSANKIPASSDVTTGYLSRWVVIPFPNDFTGREDRGLDAKLQTKTELQGIAANALPALRRLLARGDFDLPESGQHAHDEFTRRVDQVRTWIDECADLHPDHPFTARTFLYTAYKAWADRDGHKPVKATEFYDRLTAAGAEPTRRGDDGTRGFVRIKVTDTAERHPWH